MKGYIRKLLAAVLALAICLSLTIPAYALNETNTLGVTFSVSLDTPKISVSDSDQTVVMRLTSSEEITVDGIGFTATKDAPLTIASITGGDELGAYDDGATNLETGITYWGSSDLENVSGVTEIAVITFTVPAKTAAGTYEVGVEGINLTKDYGTEWETGASATTSLTIAGAADPEDSIIASGVHGDNLTWTLDRDGLFVLSGIGEMAECEYFSEYSWYEWSSYIRNIRITEGITSVEMDAFLSATDLVSIEIGKDVASFGSIINEIEVFYVADGNAYYSAVDGILFDKDQTTILGYPAKTLSSVYSIPDGVSEIGKSAFSHCENLATITIPDGITTIGSQAFFECKSLKAVEMPDSVTALDGVGTFSGSALLTTIRLSENISEIPYNAFSECVSLKNITIPGKVAVIREAAFRGCEALESVTFAGDAPSLASECFLNTETTAYYPDNNPTWTSEVMQDYGGEITWVAYGENPGEPGITGYSAGLSAITPVTTIGEKVNISVTVNHAEETVFNAGELVFTYDPLRLSFDQLSSTLGNATVRAENGTLVLEDYGAAKNCGNGIYTLAFDAVADGNATVKLTSAAFSNLENAVASDLMEAIVNPDTVDISIGRKSFEVILPEGMDGAEFVTDGESYTFVISDENYIYSNVTATVDGQPVPVIDNGDGSYTINAVSGVLNISAMRTPKTYNVTFTGSAAADIMDAAAVATYDTDYQFTVPTTTGWTYSLGGITIGGNSYTGYSAEGSVYTIPGTAITGDIVITVNKAQVTTSVTVTGSGAGAAEGYVTSAEIGEPYTLVLNPEEGYSYTVTATMGGKSVQLTQDGNKYTIAKVTGNIVFTVERTVIVSGVTVTEYVSVDGNKVWLIKNAATLADGKIPTYDGNKMFWSESYDAYCYLVIAVTLREEDAKAAIAIADGSAVEIDYGMDVNMTGTVDANDAQLAYNIYNAYYDAFDATASMEKFLRADVNKDGKVNTTDSAAIINQILNG